MGWTFFWLMVVLKVPIAGLFYIVWWAVHQTDEDPVSDGDGGSGVPPHPSPSPRRGPWPRRRGPHGAPAQQQPAPRTRTPVHARGVSAERH
ncbi:MAG TPA: hypothetical protein VFB41_06275 [Solirubrobacteraceae bacterium]|nr:hypothetical protein [Solirubrobacteraceae bacterium]